MVVNKYHQPGHHDLGVKIKIPWRVSGFVCMPDILEYKLTIHAGVAIDAFVTIGKFDSSV